MTLQTGTNSTCFSNDAGKFDRSLEKVLKWKKSNVNWVTNDFINSMDGFFVKYSQNFMAVIHKFLGKNDTFTNPSEKLLHVYYLY